MKCRLDCRYSPQNICNAKAKNLNPHKKPISLSDVPICTRGMQRTRWPEASTIIVTGPYWFNTATLKWMSFLQDLHSNCLPFAELILSFICVTGALVKICMCRNTRIYIYLRFMICFLLWQQSTFGYPIEYLILVIIVSYENENVNNEL